MTGSNVCLILAPTSCNRLSSVSLIHPWGTRSEHGFIGEDGTNLSPLLRLDPPLCAQGTTPTSTLITARSALLADLVFGSLGPYIATCTEVRP